MALEQQGNAAPVATEPNQPSTPSQSAPPPAGATPQTSGQRQQQRPQYRGGGRQTGRGQGPRGSGGPGRGGTPRQQDGRGGRGGVGPVSIAPSTGIPFGHVPAYLPGSSSLVEELESRVLVVLRDGRHLVGILRSFDQYSNMVLDEASERRIHRSKAGVTYFADIPLGLYMVRGDSVVLLGQIGADDGMEQVELEELEEKIANEKEDELEWDFDKDLLA
mmetsp:Transcript_30494/g.57133  ORF Transcript_30494/g.57133 Transcript_30494/m.57133 type:complete len:219 (-) Transcript_30494:617-1273(-)